MDTDKSLANAIRSEMMQTIMEVAASKRAMAGMQSKSKDQGSRGKRYVPSIHLKDIAAVVTTEFTNTIGNCKRKNVRPQSLAFSPSSLALQLLGYISPRRLKCYGVLVFIAPRASIT